MLKMPTLRRIVECPICRHEQIVRFKDNELEAMAKCMNCGDRVVFHRPYSGPGYELLKKQEWV
jgi:transcription elongation factor Elf1